MHIRIIRPEDYEEFLKKGRVADCDCLEEDLLTSADALADIVQQIVSALVHQGYSLTIKQASHLKHAVSNYQALREFHRTTSEDV